MMLRIMGNETQTAYDGEEAVAAAMAFRPDVILLDIGLPKLNGYEACRRIREHLWGENVVLIALTGWGQEDDVRRSHEAGFDHHMVKPVNPNALMKLLADLQATTALKRPIASRRRGAGYSNAACYRSRLPSTASGHTPHCFSCCTILEPISYLTDQPISSALLASSCPAFARWTALILSQKTG